MKFLARGLLAASLCAVMIAPVTAASAQQPQQRQTQSQAAPAPAKKQVQCDTRTSSRKRQARARGECLSGWQQQKPVSDYKRRGLAAPGKGQKWVNDNGAYVLVDIATGIIARIVNQR